jgi:hypothetical protein
MKRHGVKKKVRLAEKKHKQAEKKEVEEPIWLSNRLRTYLSIALAVVIIAIVASLILNYLKGNDSNAPAYGTTSYMPVDSSFEGKISLLEKTGDDFAAKGSWNDAASAYLNAIQLMDYNVSYKDVPRIFGKYCQSKISLGQKPGELCMLKNPRDGRTLVKQM